MPVGTEARTGLVCIAVLAGLMLMRSKRRFLYGPLMALAALAAIPFLPASFTQRMSTIEYHSQDESASTRPAVWKWPLDYVKDHPGGGGFDNYLTNKLTYVLQDSVIATTRRPLDTSRTTQHDRAHHH